MTILSKISSNDDSSLSNMKSKLDSSLTNLATGLSLADMDNENKPIANECIAVNSMCTLHRAILKGKTKKVFRYLSQKNKATKINKQDENGRCALHHIAASGNVQLLRLIINMENVQLEIRDKNGRTPFFMACQNNSLDCMSELNTHNATVYTRDNNGDSPLDYVIKNYVDDFDALVKYLIEECKIYIDGKNDLGMTPLHLAAMLGHVDLVHYLIENKAAINLPDVDGNTPLQLAITFEKHDVAEKLRFFGAKQYVEETTSDEADSDDNDVKLKLKKLMSERDDVVFKHALLKQENKCLEEEVTFQRTSFDKETPKKRKNIIHGITKKSTRLVSKYVPKQTYKHLNEQERNQESEKLQQKYTELESNYTNVALNTDRLNCNLLDFRVKVEHLNQATCDVSSNNIDRISTELTDIKAARQTEMLEMNSLKTTLKELKMKFQETKRKLTSFTRKSTELRNNLQNEVDELKACVQKKDEELVEYKNGKLDQLKEVLQRKQQAIQEGEELQNNLVNKYQQLKKKYEKNQNNNK